MLPWQTALRDLRSTFYTNSHNNIYELIIRAKIDFNSLGPSEHLALPDGISEVTPIGHPQEFQFASPSKPGWRIRPVFFGSDSASLPEFLRLAREAARCIFREPSSPTDETLLPVRWLNFVVDLALEQKSGSPLIANALRCRPLSHPLDFSPCTDEELAVLLYEPHYIRLPSNVFRASVWAIDLVLHESGKVEGQPTLVSDRAGKGVAPRKWRNKTRADVLLIAAYQNLIDKGEWGKTDMEIFKLADISRDSFYRLVKENKLVKALETTYKNGSIGQGPVRRKDL